MKQHEQTWDQLEAALDTIEYGRDPLPAGRERFQLIRDDESNYAVLYVFTYNVNTYPDPDDSVRMRLTRHEFVVPIATYHQEAWTRWVFDRIATIELHETTEWFFVNGDRVYAPHHGNGWDPYSFWPGHDVAQKRKAPGQD